MSLNQKIVFFGTPEFAVPTLKALHQEGYDIVLVVSQPDKPMGRKQILTPAAVKFEAEKLGLEVTDNLEGLRLRAKDLRPAIGIVIAYGQIIPPKILDLFPYGCLNIHPSLLPKYRGPSPIQAAILNGDKATGVTIIKLDEEMDHGDYVSCITYHLSSDETAESLSQKLADEGAKLLIETLPDYLTGKIKLVPQDDSQATYTKILKRADGEIDWRRSAAEIERQVRAYYPWPGSWCDMKIKDLELRIKILLARVTEELSTDEVGKFQNINGQLYVRCGRGSLIIERLQSEGKKEMTGKEFINGYLNQM